MENAPVRGRDRGDIRKGLRVLALDKNAVAAFELDENKQVVTIIVVFCGGQDYETIVRDD